jgi:branched-chain amino acid aminotransferase
MGNNSIESLVWQNGKIVDTRGAGAAIGSHTLHYGVGIFDGIMAYSNQETSRIFEGAAHFDRFCRSCGHLDFAVRWTPRQLLEGCQELLSKFGHGDYYIRPLAYHPESQLQLTGRVSQAPADIVIMAMAVKRPLQAQALTCRISTYRRLSGLAIPVHWKACACYANSYLVRKEAEATSFDDGIMLGERGQICEASAANIFFVKNELLITPAIELDIFPGITRGILIQLAKRRNIVVAEREVGLNELASFDAAFLTATLMGVRPVSRIGDLEYLSIANPVVKQLIDDFGALIYSPEVI